MDQPGNAAFALETFQLRSENRVFHIADPTVGETDTASDGADSDAHLHFRERIDGIQAFAAQAKSRPFQRQSDGVPGRYDTVIVSGCDFIHCYSPTSTVMPKMSPISSPAAPISGSRAAVRKPSRSPVVFSASCPKR